MKTKLPYIFDMSQYTVQAKTIKGDVNWGLISLEVYLILIQGFNNLILGLKI